MNYDDAISILIDFARKVATDSERVHVYDAVARAAAVTEQDIASSAKYLAEIGADARAMARQLREIDAAQLRFEQLLRRTSETDGPQVESPDDPDGDGHNGGKQSA